MDSAYLFGIASQRNAWLTARQSVVAENVANADTPDYKAKDIAPFEDVLNQIGMRMVADNEAHISMGSGATEGVAHTGKQDWVVDTTDKDVSLEQEMLKAGEVSRAYSLNTSIVKAFNRMVLSTVKG
ncbi:flagellar basal body rod protein FlgB [Jiella sonneratiae]|uniref:Flagellar basal body rod protein FlgB n=1 Tax=Jiella sonneratiae TaxID=2816856 RepID=A0ABS3J4X7_9HYPH|nr:flagellar basal body rod protein FlgB [Jiella sonneratiae]MBO0903626.1 flagellar basal body rod protein FlgB [Jiella sonneratiae]